MIRTSLSFTSQAGKAGRRIGSPPLSRLTGASNPALAGSPPKTCNYEEPAALFVRESSRLRYLGFDSAALALRHANEGLTSSQLQLATLEVGDVRFVGDEMRQLYLAADYPLPRPAVSA